MALKTKASKKEKNKIKSTNYYQQHELTVTGNPCCSCSILIFFRATPVLLGPPRPVSCPLSGEVSFALNTTPKVPRPITFSNSNIESDRIEVLLCCLFPIIIIFFPFPSQHQCTGTTSKPPSEKEQTSGFPFLFPSIKYDFNSFTPINNSFFKTIFWDCSS